MAPCPMLSSFSGKPMAAAYKWRGGAPTVCSSSTLASSHSLSSPRWGSGFCCDSSCAGGVFCEGAMGGVRVSVMRSWLCVCTAALLLLASPASCARFDELFQPSWAADHVLYDGELVQLKLDNYTGCGFASKSKYLFGKTTAEIKLVPGDSAGTVTAFYMSSEGSNHHEFDFEFLGNTTGEPILVQTNVYVNGVGNREQRVGLWFDATTGFHTYGILWNPKQVVFMVDETPIRVFRNKEDRGLAFPKDQPMGVYSSIWNADDWATQGGRVKTDWSHAPFVTTYRNLQIDACEFGTAAWEDDMRRCSGEGEENGRRFWWQAPIVEELSVHQSHQLQWVRAHHLVYDYCADDARFPTIPPECER